MTPSVPVDKQCWQRQTATKRLLQLMPEMSPAEIHRMLRMPAGGSADASWRDAQHPAEGNRLQLRCMPHEGLASGLAICSSAAGLHNLLDRIPVCPSSGTILLRLQRQLLLLLLL